MGDTKKTTNTKLSGSTSSVPINYLQHNSYQNPSSYGGNTMNMNYNQKYIQYYKYFKYWLWR